jgi:hypothetical protein
MVAANALSGDMPFFTGIRLRTAFFSMFANCQKPLQKKGPKLSAFWILVGKLRPRLGELPRDREITATSTSIAAPASASMSQRESFFRTDSRAEASPCAR